MNKIFLQSFHDVQIKPIQIFLQGKSFFFFNYVQETPLWNYLGMFIVVTVRTEKIISSDLLGIIRWLKR